MYISYIYINIILRVLDIPCFFSHSLLKTDSLNGFLVHLRQCTVEGDGRNLEDSMDVIVLPTERSRITRKV